MNYVLTEECEWQEENPTHPPIVIVTIVAKELEEPPHL